MGTIKHKIFGTGVIIEKDETHVVVRFDRDASERRFVIPESFVLGLIEADESLQREVDAAIEARKEADRKAREEKDAERAAAKKASKPAYTGGNRTSADSTWRTTVTSLDYSIKDGYEEYLIKNDYTEVTPSGAPSTVPQYVKAIDSVLEEERLTWSDLEGLITQLTVLYGEGGAKEALGNKSNKTWINALKRFNDFVNP